jgi:hypothetical protein
MGLDHLYRQILIGGFLTPPPPLALSLSLSLSPTLLRLSVYPLVPLYISLSHSQLILFTFTAVPMIGESSTPKKEVRMMKGVLKIMEDKQKLAAERIK